MNVTILALTSASLRPFPVSGSGRLQQERQQIVRRRAATGQQGLASRDEITNHLLEEADGRPCSQVTDTRDPGRQAENIDRVDTTQAFEIAGDRAP